jgi:peroxiredoxin
MYKKTLALSFAAAVAILMLLGGGCEKASSPPSVAGPATPEGIGQGDTAVKPAPDFSLTTFDGASYSLAELRGRPVILFFWSSRCPACARAAPHVEAFHQAHTSEGLLVLGVAGFDSKKALKAKADSLGVTFPIAISAETGRSYGVRAIPMAFFINREGDLAASILGAQPKVKFEAALRKIL